MRAIIVSLVLFICLVPAVAEGQTYDRFRLPEGRRCSVAAEVYQCYNLGEYRELLHIDEDLRHLTELHATDLERIAALTEASTELRLSLEATQANVTLLEAERVRLREMWTEENRLRREAENRPTWDWLPWTLTAVFAIATLILAIVVGVQ